MAGDQQVGSLGPAEVTEGAGDRRHSLSTFSTRRSNSSSRSSSSSWRASRSSRAWSWAAASTVRSPGLGGGLVQRTLIASAWGRGPIQSWRTGGVSASVNWASFYDYSVRSSLERPQRQGGPAAGGGRLRARSAPFRSLPHCKMEWGESTPLGGRFWEKRPRHLPIWVDRPRGACVHYEVSPHLVEVAGAAEANLFQ